MIVSVCMTVQYVDYLKLGKSDGSNFQRDYLNNRK